MTAKKRADILLADDGSMHAQAAVDLLLSLPLPPKIFVKVLRVFTPGQIPSIGEFENALEKTRCRFVDRGIRAETELLLGHPAEKITELAGSIKPDLVVMGALGLRSTLGILLGGVAQQVVEYASCPVLIVRAPFQGLRRVLLVTDGSANSRHAGRFLQHFPLPDSIDLKIMHVLQPERTPLLMEPYPGGWQTVYSKVLEDEAAALVVQERKGRAMLTRTCESFEKNGMRAEPVLCRGDAATEIIQYVKANQVDLIVAGSRGLSEISAWWMGSVSRKLLHYSNCSVLVVKASEKE